MASRLGRAAVASLVVVVGCSGKTADGPIQVQFSQATLTSTFAQGAEVPGVQVLMTFSRPPPKAPQTYVYRIEEQSEPVLDRERSWMWGNGEIAPMSLFPSCALEPGLHEGSLTLRAYDDGGIELPLTGNVLPYSITVTPGFSPSRVTAEVDGVPQPGFKTVCGLGTLDLRVTAGQTVVLTTTSTVDWSATSVGNPPGGPSCIPDLQTSSATLTDWTFTVIADYPASNVPCGTIVAEARAPDGVDPYRGFEIRIDVVTR